jgi:hypothetical protein
VTTTVALIKTIGVPTFYICNFIGERFWVPLDIGDVEKVGLAWNSDSSLQETRSLGAFLWEQYGRRARFATKSLETDEGPEAFRVAVITQAPKERSNIEKYGGVIILDGTQIDRCTLRWDVFPVTLIDYDKQMVCGGVFFLGFQTAEIFDWVLESIHDCCGGIWKTQLTDEDSALTAAVPTFVGRGHDIVHSICALHKRGNIVKQIHALNYARKGSEGARLPCLVKKTNISAPRVSGKQLPGCLRSNQHCSIFPKRTNSKRSSGESPWGHRKTTKIAIVLRARKEAELVRKVIRHRDAGNAAR